MEVKVRITYDQGRLEIMGSSLIHERWSELLGMIVRVLASETRQTLCSGGSTTLDRDDLDRAIEPDKCFYLENEPKIRGNRKIDLHKDPPPDLAIESEVSQRAIKQLPVYEAIRVPEVWRTDGNRVTFHVLQPDGKYAVAEYSRSFPFLRSQDLTPFLLRWGQVDEETLLQEFRAWVKLRLSEKQ
jgi:Uma2 family endonuclease